ncbi:hypothetical protein BDB01DRAFT_797816 [Pilobolus umbonatus]|nr:hypothetical protein BDB01DRAFT_797816 [Pilobolus umbonatus]
MHCPKHLKNKKIEITAPVKNRDFFKNYCVNEWTFENFIHWHSSRSQIKILLQENKYSLNSLLSKQKEDKDLISYVASLLKQKYSDKELEGVKSPEIPIVALGSNINISANNSNVSFGNIICDRQDKRKHEKLSEEMIPTTKQSFNPA